MMNDHPTSKCNDWMCIRYLSMGYITYCACPSYLTIEDAVVVWWEVHISQDVIFPHLVAKHMTGIPQELGQIVIYIYVVCLREVQARSRC